MDAAELRKLLDDAGLSQRGTAKQMEIDERTMRRYASGESTIPRVVEFAVRWLVHTKKDAPENA